MITKKFRVTLSILLVLLAVNHTYATGFEIKYEPIKTFNLSFGSFWGNDKISLIQPSSFMQLKYKNRKQTKNYLIDFKTGFTYSSPKVGSHGYELSVLSMNAGIVRQFYINKSLNLGIGLNQDIIYYYGWKDWLGGEYELSPGLNLVYNLSPEMKLVTGINSEIIFASDNVQNANFFRSNFVPLKNSLWLKLVTPKLVDVETGYTYGLAIDRINLQVSKKFGGKSVLRIGAESQKSKNMLFSDKNVFQISTELLFSESISLSVSSEYEQVRYPNGYSVNDGQIIVGLKLSLGGYQNGTIELTKYEEVWKDKFVKDKYSYTYPASYFDLKDKTESGIRNNSYSEFSNYLKTNIDTPEKVIWLASVMGRFTGRYVYDYQGLTLQGAVDDGFKDTLRNTATSEQVYQALQDSLWTGENNPVTVCRGIGKFVADIANIAGIPNVEAYTAHVQTKKSGHIIVPIVTPEQIYIVNYDDIIPTGSRNISTALQIYQNLVQSPILQHYIYGIDGKLLSKIDTVDTWLLNRFLTVQQNESVGNNLKQLFEQMQ